VGIIRLLAIYPFPCPVELPLPPDVRVAQALPGSPGTVLGINAYPPWVCDVAVVTRPEGLPVAIEVALSGNEDDRIYSVADYMRDLIGGREMDEYELRMENLDYEASGVVFR